MKKLKDLFPRLGGLCDPEKLNFWDEILKILDLNANEFFHFPPKQLCMPKQIFLELKSSGFKTSFANCFEKSIIGNLLFPYLKVVITLILLTR